MSFSEEYVEGYVCNNSDVKDNEMKQFDLGSHGKVLMIRQAGKLSAVGTKCTHYGAPLIEGALGRGRVRCPWHGACFNVTTGDIEDFPGLDSLPRYQVTVTTNGRVKVRAKKSELESNNRIKNMGNRNCYNYTTFVIIGGGPSAAECVESLRQNFFTGRIIIISKENALPYDRVQVSKSLDAPVEALQLRTDDFYKTNDIEVKKGVYAIHVNCRAKSVMLSNGEQINYTALYLATGSRARLIPLTGSDLRNVFTLRSIADSAAIYGALGSNKDKHVVILGTSFIGMEAAAYCIDKARSVTVIGRDSVPFRSVFGEAVGASLMKVFMDKGIQFRMNTNIKACNGRGPNIASVELTNGNILPADILIMGTGSILNTEFLRGSGLTINEDGSIPVNEKLQTNVLGVFAGGDIAKAPVFCNGGKPATIGHYGLAQYHGKIAALNMLDKCVQLKAVPFFWTRVFGRSVQYCGYGNYKTVRIEGNVDDLRFVAFYFDESGKVVAMTACQRDPVISQFAEYLFQGKTLHANDLSPDPFGWVRCVAKENC